MGGSGNRVGLDLELFRQQVGFPGERLVVPLRGSAAEPAGEREVAVDLLAGNEVDKVLARLFGFDLDGRGALLAELAHHVLKARPQIAAGDATVAGRGAFAGAHLVEHLHRPAGPRQRDGRRQPRISGSDHHHVALGRDRGVRQALGWRRLPPVGLSLLHGIPEAENARSRVSIARARSVRNRDQSVQAAVRAAR